MAHQDSKRWRWRIERTGGVMLICMVAVFMPAFAVSAQSAEIRGTVVDSLSDRVLRIADVQLVPVSNPAEILTTRTDSGGSFRFTGIKAGEYHIGFAHSVLDSLGLDPVSFRIAVAPGETRRLDLSIPSARTLIRSLCNADVDTDSTGLFIGNVRATSHGAELARVDRGVRVTWAELQFQRFGLKLEHPVMEATPGPGGWFAMCGLPLSTPISVRAWQGTDSTGLLELELPADGFLRRDLLVGSASTRVDYTVERAIRGGDGIPAGFRYDTTAASRIARGGGSLRGTVRLLNGSPVADTRVEIYGTGLSTTTNANGAFAIDSLPLGSQTIVARLLGLAPHRGIVDLVPDQTVSYDIVLAPFVATLERVKVTVPGTRPLWMAGFEERRSGRGTHFDGDEIARRNPFSLPDLLQGLTGITVLRTGVFEQRILMRTTGNNLCSPVVFVDGLRVSEQFIPDPAFIQGLEVYHRATLTPPEFLDPRGGCGSIVIWTGQRR
jgi:hypothetical protein